MQDLIVGLQQDYNDLKQDYNDLKEHQIDLQLELRYMQEQKEIAEMQVLYLQDKLKSKKEKKVKEVKKVGTKGN